MKLTFCGGAGMVTGSNFILEDDRDGKTLRIMIDCGLMQGGRDAEARNWEKWGYDPAAIDFLLVTHAHIDHIGRIPKLVRDGFRGAIISTEPTRALAEPMLEDSRELLKMAAETHARPLLYDEKDVEAALKLWRSVSYHENVDLGNGITADWGNAGHILGAGVIRFMRNGRSIAFTGDLGSHSDLLDTAEFAEGTQYLVMESVYGDRTHDERERHRDTLQRIVEATHKRGGTLLIPAFSTERTQDLLFDIRMLLKDGNIPSMPVFLDSPLAIKVTDVFQDYPQYFKPDIAASMQAGEELFSFDELRIVNTVGESRHIAATDGPKIIIAGSGMSMGGRVLSHEKEILADKQSTLCIVGYQSAGSIGRRLLDGENMITIRGEGVPVRARIEHIFSYSAHKDSRELLEFAAVGEDTLEKVFVVMGEPAASACLAQRLRDYAGLNAMVPKEGESVEIQM